MRVAILIPLYLLFVDFVNSDQLVPRNSAEVDSSYIGVQTVWVDLAPFRQDITRKVFDAGVKWCRLGVPWNFVEPESIGHYSFATIDTILYQLVAHNITPYMIVSDANKLYNPNGFPPIPESTYYFNAWLAYVDTVVKRYQTHVKHWEIWNEPNGNGVWLPAANPAQYSSLVIPTAQRIKSIDPTAIVSLGGTAVIDIPFIQSCLEYGVGDYIDKIAFHPYRTLPEAPQSLLVWQPNPQFVSPYGSYEEEIQALRDTIALYSDSIEIWDTEGCFLSDSIYPDPLSPDPYHPQHASLITQAKYLARRYILNLKYDVELTTWTMTWDMTSLATNQGKSDWIDDYTDRTDFSFVEGPYMGLIYSPQNMYTHTLEGEHFSLIHSPMEVTYDPSASNDTCVWTPNGTGDSGYVYYDFNLLEPGWYTYWSRSMGINDSISIFLILLDSTYFMVGNWYAMDEYRWSSAMSQYIRFLYLDSASHDSYVVTYWDGSKFDAWKLMKVDTVCLCKTSYYVLQNICSVFDADISTTDEITAAFTNIDADSATFSTLTYATFEHDIQGNYFIPYWFALVAEDNYSERLVRLTIHDTSLTYAKLINFITGEVSDLTYSIIGDSVIFDSLPATDFPYCVATDFTPGVEEYAAYAAGHVKMLLFPNPASEQVHIRFNTIGNTTASAIVRIYDVSGRLVKNLTRECRDYDGNGFIWNCTDESGSQVPAGIYFCQYSTSELLLVEKFIVVR